MKIKSLVILAIILLSLIPVYMINKYLQKRINPRASMQRLFLYLFTGFLLVFIYTFLLVLFIKNLFPEA